MNDFVKQVIEETFASKRQQRYFYHKAEKSPKWAKMAKEFSDKTDFSKLPEKAADEEVEVDEIVDNDGNIARGDTPGNPNAFIRSKKTSDQVAKAAMGQMGSFGILGGATGANKTLKYWAEADMSKALGADEIITDPKMDFKKAKKHFKKDLDVPEKEAEERAEDMGYPEELEGTGRIRLIENPKKYIEEYLARKIKDNELVKRDQLEVSRKNINPIILKQLKSIKQTLKDNNLTVRDITEYLEDNGE
jgi:hypothetical protein